MAMRVQNAIRRAVNILSPRLRSLNLNPPTASPLAPHRHFLSTSSSSPPNKKIILGTWNQQREKVILYNRAVTRRVLNAPTDKDINEFALFAVNEQNKQQLRQQNGSAKFRFLQVIGAEYHRCAGLYFYITLDVVDETDNNKIKRFTAGVWYRSWLKSKSLDYLCLSEWLGMNSERQHDIYYPKYHSLSLTQPCDFTTLSKLNPNLPSEKKTGPYEKSQSGVIEYMAKYIEYYDELSQALARFAVEEYNARSGEGMIEFSEVISVVAKMERQRVKPSLSTFSFLIELKGIEEGSGLEKACKAEVWGSGSLLEAQWFECC